MMKKLALVAALATTLAFVACSKQEAPVAEQKPTANEAVEQQAAIDASKIDAAPVEGPVAPNPNAPAEENVQNPATPADAAKAEEKPAADTTAPADTAKTEEKK